MKVKLKDLRANPYRDLKKNPINWKRVDDLIESIEATKGLWKNSMPEARRVNGELQLTFGYHRVEALKKLYGEDYELDMEIEEYDARTAYGRMSRENQKDNATESVIIDESVRGAYKYLKGNLHDWEEVWKECGRPLKNGMNSPKGGSVHGHFLVETAGINDAMISKLSGHSLQTVKISKARINAKDLEFIDSKAIDSVSASKNSHAMTKALKTLKKDGIELSPSKQKDIARKINEGKYAAKDLPGNVIKDVKDEIRKSKADYVKEEKKKARTTKQIREAKKKEIELSFDTYIMKASSFSNQMSKFTTELLQLSKDMVDYEITDKDVLAKYADMKLTMRKTRNNLNELLTQLNVK